MPLQQLQCVFVSISPLLSALVAEAVSRRVELRLLAQFDGRDGLAERLEALNPQIVVVGLGPGESDDIGASLLAHVPRAKILLISGGGDYAYVYEMQLHRGVLFDFSPDTLAAAICAADGAASQPYPPSSD
jgi:DNA-binding NarL/FixJ family response regulator